MRCRCANLEGVLCMNNEPAPLTSYSEEQRKTAVHKYRIIEPYLIGEKKLNTIVGESGFAKRTLHYWIQAYEQFGLCGLIRQKRSDANHIKLAKEVISEVEQLIYKYPKNSLTSIQRKICTICEKNQRQTPSYAQVYAIAKSLSPAAKTLATDGTKAYENQYDLIHRREADYPNEFWQADHTLLDIVLINQKGQAERPWLTIILDEYSRGVAGFFLTFQAPSAIQTALVLHQAIWRKNHPDWTICGIPEHFYTDHGSDFTSNHLEQVAIDLKINLVFSAVGVPRGRGKIERFFLTVNQLFLQDLPGYLHNKTTEPLLSLHELDVKLSTFIIDHYHKRVHGTTKQAPMLRWNQSGFLPNMPENLEQLDLLLLQVAKARKVHSDGIHFQGLRYIEPNLAAFVGETVVIRFDPRDLAEIRVFYEDRYLCTAISPEIADYTVDLKEIVAARNKRKRALQKQITPEKTVIEEVVQSKQSQCETNSVKPKSNLKRYFNE